MLELQTTSPQHSSGRAKGGLGLSLKAGQGWGGDEGPRWGWSVIKSYERPQGPDTCHLDTGILELMPVRRSGRTAGIEFLQHQPRLACPDALRWHFKLLFSWSNSKLSAIKKSLLFPVCSDGQVHSANWSCGKLTLWWEKEEQCSSRSASWVSAPHSCRGVRSSKGKWDPHSGVG